MAAVRPTPADPTPGLAVAPESGDQRAIPPELGPNTFAVLSGPTFMYSDLGGDVPPGSIGGLVHLKSGVRDRSAEITRRHEPDGSRLCFDYANEGFAASTEVRCSLPADRLEGDVLVWEVELRSQQEWLVDLFVPLPPGMGVVETVHGDIAEVLHRRVEDPLRRWIESRATLHSDNPVPERTIERTKLDLAALRLDLEIRGQRVMLPGAGLPWFLTVFGRDTLITAYQTLVGGPTLAQGALLALARLQGNQCDDFTDEEPGKILHEVRSGELTRNGSKPYAPYYGTADATQLWLILLSEYWRWTGDDNTVRYLRDNALAALRWIDEYGDRDGDGYVEYATRSPEGLGNQCWRDSPDGVQFSDGRIPVLPVATSDIQGYTYDAKLRLA